MAQFLNTSGISFYLEELIKKTNEKLILVSPYLQFSERIKEHIENLCLQKKDIRIIYRDNRLHPDENNWLGKQIGVRTSICKNLHAKCYINENQAILTSMNLYEFSQINNNEMGISFTKKDDPDLYKAASDEVERLLKISEEFRITVQKVPEINKQSSSRTNNHSTGYCIRTGVSIPFNIEKPMCLDAFRIWNEFGNPEYPEKFCHFSGEPSNGETSFLRPIMKKNWKRAKEVHGQLVRM